MAQEKNVSQVQCEEKGYVDELKDGEWVDREFAKPKDKTRPTVEAYPLHLYEYLFMKQVLTDVYGKWVDIPVTKGAIHTGPRINVFKYDDSGKSDKKKNGSSKTCIQH